MYELRTATDNDSASLYGIHKSAMFDYVNTTWGWEEEDQERRFLDYFRSADLQVIGFGTEDIGFLDLVESRGDLYIVNLEIVPAYQGNGIGTAIIRNVIEEARRKNLPVKLQVLKVNHDAKRLYSRLGFVCWGETPTHYLMKLEATLIPRSDRREA